MPVEWNFVRHGHDGAENELMLYRRIEEMIDGSEEMMHEQRWTNKVPDKLRHTNEKAYEPDVVFIGMFFSEDMKEHKVNYMHRLFCRTSKSKETLSHDVKQTMSKCVNAMLDEVPKFRELFPHKYKPNYQRFGLDIAQVMLVDGSFILELLYRSHHVKWSQRIGDPILGNWSLLVDVRRDLLLLENQIPFSALQSLFTLTVKQIDNPLTLTLTDYIFEFFRSTTNIVHEIKTRNVDTACHLIDLFHNCYRPDPENEPAGSREDHSTLIKYSATELDKAGVKFQAGERGVLGMSFNTSSIFSWLLCAVIPKQHISSWFFHYCGTTRFQISPLCIDDSTETFLMNLIAYEQSNPQVHQYVTCYAVLMNTILKSKDDVQVLVNAKVLQNDRALQLFNNVCKNVVLQGETLYFSKSCKDVNDYLSKYPAGNLPSKLKRNCVSMVNYFFSSRWKVISIIGALFLFALQVLQTVYTIRSSS